MASALRIAWRLIGREVIRRPWLGIVQVASVAMGVMVVGAVWLAAQAANQSFRESVETVSGRADLELRGRIPEEIFFQIVSLPWVSEAAPLVEWLAPADGVPGGYLRIVGLDPFQGLGLRSFDVVSADGSQPDLEAWLREPGTAAVRRGFQELAGANAVVIRSPTGERELKPQFVVELRGRAGVAGADLRWVMMDIAWAQEWAGMQGWLTSIQILLKPGADKEHALGELRALVPGDVQIQTPAARTRQTEGMVASFQLNLQALSMVSLLVGCYLVYNTTAAGVLRRRTEIGILRATGAGNALLRGLFLGEAGLWGIVGGLLGAAASWPLANGLAHLVAQTISSLYVLVAAEKVVVPSWWPGAGALLGLGAALVGAWIPSREALSVEPREVLHPGHLEERRQPSARRWGVWAMVSALGALLTGWLSLRLEFGGLGFLSAFFVILAMSLAAPAVLKNVALLARTDAAAVRLPAEIAVGWQYLGRSLHRNTMTVSALAAALALVVSITVMISSFRESVERWMDRTLAADLYAAPAINEIAGAGHYLPEKLLAHLRGLNGVKLLATFEEVPVVVAQKPAMLAVFDGPARGEWEFLPVKGGNIPSGRSPRDLVEKEGWVALSESLGRKLDVLPGGEIELPFPDGLRKVRVAGWIRDYTRDTGAILLPSSLWRSHGGRHRPQSVALFFEPEQRSEAMRQARALLEQASAEGLPLSIYENQQLRERVREIFDQTFAVTGLLRLVAIIVAVGGVATSLGILVQERARETAVVRAVGASRFQMVSIILAGAAGLGFCAALLGLAGGAGLAAVLTHVINAAFFGWTVELRYPLEIFLLTPIWVILVACLAGLVPAGLAAKTPPALVLRYE